ncbi:MAG TPA: anti-sigma factor [Levilinea sp.]|nr:anti-sigma factor [Levilinea sp.]
MNPEHNCHDEHLHGGQSCRELLALLSDYIDGELREDLCAEIEWHMADCTNCRIVVDTLQKTVNLYHSEHAPALPVNMRDRLFHRLELDDFKKY